MRAPGLHIFGSDEIPADEANRLTEIARAMNASVSTIGETVTALKARGRDAEAMRLVATVMIAVAQGLGAIEAVELTFEDGTGVACSTMTGGEG